MKFRIFLALVTASILCFTLTSGASAVPSNERTRAVQRRVVPTLKSAFDAKGLTWGSPVFIRIFKESDELEMWIEDDETGWNLFKTYKICFYTGGLGPKLARGDRKSPEGFYFVTPGRMNPWSTFHLSFDLGYPNAYDLTHDRTGGSLMVHGDCVSIGCYAMTDKNIEEIYTLCSAALSNGQPFFRAHIFPFRMTAQNMTRHQNSRWFGFWENLKQGYDIFEVARKVPNVEVRNKRYVFD